MIGENELIINQQEMNRAMQCYIDKMFCIKVPKVISVTYSNNPRKYHIKIQGDGIQVKTKEKT